MRGNVARASVMTAILGCSLLSGSARGAIPELGSWTREGVVFADVTVNNPDLVPVPGGGVRAYFMQGGEVLSALSADRLSFVVEEDVRVDAAGHPAAVKLPDGRIRIYYASTAPEDAGAIRSAVSEDGLTFIVEQGVRLRPGPSGAPDDSGIIHLDVLRVRGGYRLFYDAVASVDGDGPDWRGIRSAFSEDGLKWRKDRGFRIRPGRDPIRFAHLVWSPFVERTRRGVKLFFSVETDRRPAERAGVYVATSRDGLSFSIRADVVLGLDPDVGSDPGYGAGGMLGLPQDVVIVDVEGGRRMFYWQAGEGTLSAFLSLA